MRYKNAADILPDHLLREIQKYTSGEVLYIPQYKERKKWGEGSGAKAYYEERNEEIRRKFGERIAIEQLAKEYNLSVETIKKIVYG